MKFEDVCRENYAKIYNFILAKTGNKEVAEDITQDVFLIAYKKGKKFLKHEKPVAFLYVTARNLISQYFKQSAKFSFQEIEIESGSKDVFEEICKERAYLFDESPYQELVLLELTKSERDLYREYYVDKKPMKVIAKELEMSEPAVRMKYMRIRRKVQNIVAKLKLDDF